MIALYACVRKEKQSDQINVVIVHPDELGKKETKLNPNQVKGRN